MFIWTGFGYLIVLVPIVVIWISRIMLEPILGGALGFDMAKWPLLLTFIISAVILFFINKKLEKQKGRIVIDKAAGKEITLKNKHSLFFIDFKYWPYVVAVLAVIAFIK